MMAELKNDDPEAQSPDILEESAKVLRAIFAEHLSELPSYIKDLSLENYFSEQVTGKYAIQNIRTAWRTNPKVFEINTRSNFICYATGENWDADCLLKELPETLCARRSRDSIIMDLDAARDFFGIDFKHRSIFDRFIGR